MIKKCGRCGTDFSCRADDITACDCYKVAVSAAARSFLQKTTYDCLCNTCLTHYTQILAALEGQTLPEPSQYQMSLHYYKDGGKFVFTETYLLLRGYCCQNGCRHCPYGFKKKA